MPVSQMIKQTNSEGRLGQRCFDHHLLKRSHTFRPRPRAAIPSHDFQGRLQQHLDSPAGHCRTGYHET
eukprot:1798139-Amphidinium_carterae.1